ncbi:Holliday junction resolvase YqgF [Thermobaculum terrenum ATCC BAA-798]|uniref:Putative pre-16S rRNA nuclease n=2 Tax=Thermobaculum TaxID=262406 RepID=D1CDK4_THET1|nr:Holliday junction resolvase YqgF [Thermobaculum terrenum ATCC BAA-798]
MVVMGIDPGRKRIGIALSDPTGLLATAYKVIHRTTSDRDLEEIRRIAEHENVEKIVVGLPLHMSGYEGEEAVRARELAKQIETATGLPVELVDERLTSVEAERRLLESRRKLGKLGRKKLAIDAEAAAVLLQDYLDQERLRQRAIDSSL